MTGHGLADPLLGHQPVQFVDIANRNAVDRDDDVAAQQPAGASGPVGSRRLDPYARSRGSSS